MSDVYNKYGRAFESSGTLRRVGGRFPKFRRNFFFVSFFKGNQLMTDGIITIDDKHNTIFRNVGRIEP